MYRHIQTSLYLKGTDCLQKSSLLEPNKVKWSKETTNLKHRQPIKSVEICAKNSIYAYSQLLSTQRCLGCAESF